MISFWRDHDIVKGQSNIILKGIKLKESKIFISKINERLLNDEAQHEIMCS